MAARVREDLEVSRQAGFTPKGQGVPQRGSKEFQAWSKAVDSGPCLREMREEVRRTNPIPEQIAILRNQIKEYRRSRQVALSNASCWQCGRLVSGFTASAGEYYARFEPTSKTPDCGACSGTFESGEEAIGHLSRARVLNFAIEYTRRSIERLRRGEPPLPWRAFGAEAIAAGDKAIKRYRLREYPTPEPEPMAENPQNNPQAEDKPEPQPTPEPELRLSEAKKTQLGLDFGDDT